MGCGEMRYLIVAGGNVSDEFIAHVIKTGGFDVILAADAGMEALYRCHVLPDIIVGDFDSVDAEILEHFRKKERIEICMLNPEKDDTDTEYAIREAIRRGAKEIAIVGGTGTRMDHVLGNICLLGIGLEHGITIHLVDKHNRIRMIDAPITLQRQEQYGKYISLIPFSEKVNGVTLEGFKYPLQNYTMGGFNSLGISNEIIADEAKISLASGQLIVVESRD